MKDKPEQPEEALDRPLVQIDDTNLGRECVRIVSQYRQAAYNAADAGKDVDEAKATLEVVEAEARLHVRNTPGQYGLDKVTEGAINEIVVCQPRVLKAQQRLIKAKHRQDILSAVVATLEVKKRSLTLLVELHGMSYFADVKVSREGKEAVNEQKMRKFARRNEDP
jgi:hypothetical protein